ncbi:MAG: ATPase, T2SS/T4P/T4SS family [Pseudomonadota bacterium]
MEPDTTNYPKLTEALERAHLGFPALLADKYPRILEQLERTWGSKEAVQYLDSLVMEERGDRAGFTIEALRDVGKLKQLHEYIYPELSINPYDPFSGINFAEDFADFSTLSEGNEVFSATEAGKPFASAPSPETEKRRTSRNGWPLIGSQHQLRDTADLLRHKQPIYAMQGQPIGKILIHFGCLDEETLSQAEAAQDHAGAKHKALGQVLVETGAIDDEIRMRALCVQAGIPMVDLSSIAVPNETFRMIPIEKLREKLVVPLSNQDDAVFLAVHDPFTFTDLPFFSFLVGKKIVPVYSPKYEIINRLNLYGSGRTVHEDREEFRNLAKRANELAPKRSAAPEQSQQSAADVSENDSIIINMVNQMIVNAIHEKASDIHVELFQNNNESNIRFRRDGKMEHFSDFPKSYHNAVVSRIKIMAGLDISERRRPQDGKISFNLNHGDTNHIDLRVATIPTVYGIEFVTIRILTASEPLPLTKIGMTDQEIQIFRDVFQRPYGLILVCGPTGSGKTTTLHSVLSELNTDDRKIWTAEDPVEIVQPHLCQVQVNSKIGLTFANVLRSFMRADPDIIMIGEMRDEETAKIALEASMTGHLVLSTLHTNSASETMARLTDLGVDPFNLSDALLAILAQRLARKLCHACARKEEASLHELEEMANEYYYSAYGKSPSMSERETILQSWRDRFGDNGAIYLHRAVGCKKCTDGYSGRIGLFELLQATTEIRHLIRDQVSAADYQAAGIKEGMHTLKQDGIIKVLQGITDMTQVHSACV